MKSLNLYEEEVDLFIFINIIFYPLNVDVTVRLLVLEHLPLYSYTNSEEL